jgi:dCTP deaminase
MILFMNQPQLEPNLFPAPDGSAGDRGLLTGTDIEALAQRGAISPISPNQVQPASLDLKLGERGFILPASFLPGEKSRVESKAKGLSLEEFRLTEKGMALEPNKVYLIELAEKLDLPDNISSFASPKSSTGRLDIFTRLISDYGSYYDILRTGYKGGLWLEIAPRSFGVIVRPSSRLLQLRFRRGRAAFDNYRLGNLHKQQALIAQNEPLVLHQGLLLSVDLEGEICGYKAKRTSRLIDIDRVGAYPVKDFWQEIKAPKDGKLILAPDAFYILASREKVRIPATHAAEMMPFDSQIGEFRAHYAGFFDSGFGVNTNGAKAVLEMRARETPFLLEHGQIIGRLVFEQLKQKASIHYDERKNANYQGQGLKLSKHFR